MVNISKALNAKQAQNYHKLEFTSESQNYWKQGGAVEGEWQGALAEKLGLTGAVSAEQFARLSEGKHPDTEQQMVKHREQKEYKNADGSTTKSVEHRAGWDATFSAPKSVSLTALVGGDERVREAHREAVTAALQELERYTQARIGGNNPAETTGKFAAAKFEHDTARPVDGYAAPQLHTHAVIFNVTEREDGSTRALQERGLFDSQNFATAVYQSALTYRLRNLGYEIEAGRSGAPEIKGYSQEYLDASSPRSQQIREHMEKNGLSGAAAAQIAAHATRDSKQVLTPEQVLAAHKEIAAGFGNQADRVVSEARKRANTQERKPEGTMRAREAVAYAKAHIYEREAVSDERGILRDALRRGMGEATYAEVRAEFDKRMEAGEFKQVQGQKHDSGRRFTTSETIFAERANVAIMQRGRDAVEPMLGDGQAKAQADSREKLNQTQRAVIEEVLTSRDRVHGLQGTAGTGKTTILEVIREGAEKGGYTVEGFAPTSKAAGALRDAGIEAGTLQSFLVRGDRSEDQSPDARHLYLLDESSLASTRQMRAFLEKIRPEDRVLVIGDVRQHQGVDAGRPFEQMQDAGMRTAKLDTIIRQQDNPELLKAVEHLSRNETRQGVKLLQDQGCVREIADPKQRIEAIAKDYAEKPEDTLIISPDNVSRREINQAVRVELQAKGLVGSNSREYQTLVGRSELSGADRGWAERYEAGDVLHYTRGSKAEGIERGSYTTVVAVNAKSNLLTVKRADGKEVTYDPARLKGVSAYREAERELAIGDRLQFTASIKKLSVNNRDLARVEKVEADLITVKLDGKDGRLVSFSPAEIKHFDHGYAVTSHSSQGLTTDRVIANIDTQGPRSLINARLAYVAFSRARQDVRIYTDKSENLGTRLATDVEKTAAVEFRPPTGAAQIEDAAKLIRKNNIAAGVELLQSQGRIREYATADHRLAAVALEYAKQTDKAVVIAPDRGERQELTNLIRDELKSSGALAAADRTLWVQTTRAEGRSFASTYAREDVITYDKGIEKHGIAAGTTAVVTASDTGRNLITVQKPDGEEVTYNPAQFRAATNASTLIREEKRQFTVGERIQFTAPEGELGVRARDLGTIESISDTRAIRVRLDTGAVVELDPAKPRNIDYGYAVDGKRTVKADRVLVSVENAAQLTAESPIFTSVTLAKQDAAIYISDAPALSQAPPPPSPPPSPTEAEKFRRALAAIGNAEIRPGMEILEQQGRIHEHRSAQERAAAVAAQYAANPDGAIIVAPEKGERDRITPAVRAELRAAGLLTGEDYALAAPSKTKNLAPKDLSQAANYVPGDSIEYRAADARYGIEKDSRVRVLAVELQTNALTVERADGSHSTYNPAVAHNATRNSTVYTADLKEFAEGDRIRFFTPDKELHIRLGELATVERIGDEGRAVTVRLDSGKSVELDPVKLRQFDHGYAVPHSRGIQADRVLVSAETIYLPSEYAPTQGSGAIYEALTRGREDAAIFTGDRHSLHQRKVTQNAPAFLPKQEFGHEKAALKQDQGQEPEQLYSQAERNRLYAPLNHAFAPEEAAQFRWKAQTGPVQSYQHRETGRHLHIDSRTGQFYDPERNAIGREAAWDHVLTGGHIQLHSDTSRFDRLSPNNSVEQNVSHSL